MLFIRGGGGECRREKSRTEIDFIFEINFQFSDDDFLLEEGEGV